VARRKPVYVAAAAAAAALAAVVGLAEALHWRANGQWLGSARPTPESVEAIVVLGFKNRGNHANWVNRWRVRAGIRSLDPTVREHLLVLCGGPVGGPVPEAELMAASARELGYSGPIVWDSTSRTTWQNVENAIPLIAGASLIKVVSNSLHAAKARRYLWQLRPDLAARLARGDDYRVGEQAWLKPLAAYLDFRHTVRSRSEAGTHPE